MASLIDYITKMSTDQAFEKQHNADKKSTMADFGLSEDEQQLLLGGSNAAIQKHLEAASSSFFIVHSPS